MPRKRLFLVHFTFRSGEAEIPFHHVLLASSLEQAEEKIEDYLSDFADFPNPTGYLSYEYWHGYYAVDFEDVEPATPDSIIQHLMILTNAKSPERLKLMGKRIEGLTRSCESRPAEPPSPCLLSPPPRHVP